jgi:potassium/chloride transporter 9
MKDKTKEDKQVKLGTFTGVFIPTSLNIFSILVFLRFGFILGQVGVYGFVGEIYSLTIRHYSFVPSDINRLLGMLVVCYAVDLLTFSSLSAIATNGSVRGGGAYYLISRSLGAEFGGAIGIVYYLGTTFNSGMNSVGLVKVLTYNFGPTGSWGNWLPDGYWWAYLWATCVLLGVTGICLAGSALFARAGNFLFVVIIIATFSIPLSGLLVKPFNNPKIGVEYTGINATTLRSNLYPQFTSGADGSNLDGKENWQSLFSILFPATAGIFA